MSQLAMRPLLRGELVNNVLGEGDDWSKVGRGRHLEPGVVYYEEQKDENGKVTRPAITYLLTREAIERGRPTAVGKPIVGKAGGFDHLKVNPKDHAAGKYDGDAIESYAGDDGWESLHFVVRDADTKNAMRRGYQFSCGYYPTDVDDTPGNWHGVPYDAVINNIEYTHFAVVPNPRYDGAKIELQNSKPGGTVNKPILKALLKTLMPVKELRELVNSMEEDAKKEDSEREKREAGEKAVAERKNKISDLRNAADAVEKATGDKAKAEPFRKEADDLEKLGGGDVAKEPGTPPAENAEADAAKKVEADEKAAEEKKNAEAKADADKKAAEAEENKNIAEALNAFGADMVDGAVTGLVTGADKKPLPLAAQPVELQNALRETYRASGATHGERLNAIVAKVRAKVDARVAAAKAEQERVERFNALAAAASGRDRGAVDYPVLAETTADKAALGQELYG